MLPLTYNSIFPKSNTLGLGIFWKLFEQFQERIECRITPLEIINSFEAREETTQSFVVVE
jgi:hypothetical protein